MSTVGDQSVFITWGGSENSGCLRGGSKKNEGIPGGVYKIHIWTITNSSGPPQVINTDWSLSCWIPVCACRVEDENGELDSCNQNPLPFWLHFPCHYAGEHEGSAGEHEGSTGDHDSSAGEHEDSAGDHDSSAGEHEESAGDHDSSAGEHEDSAGDHDSSAGNVYLNMTDQV